MQIGFETTAAVPKRLRAVEEQPTQQAMQGERKIRQAPSTDQKKVRRQMQRRTAAAFVPHEHPEIGEWHGSERECRGTMCTSEHNPENQVEKAPPNVARDIQDRFESYDEVHVHPHKPNTYIAEPHNTWDGPTHVIHHGEGDYSFDGYQGHSHFGPNAYEHGNCPNCDKGSSKTAANFSAGTCRMCEGNLIPMGRKPDSPSTMKAQCADCGAKHELQGAEVKKVSDLHRYASEMTEARLAELQVIAINFYVSDAKCPHCGNADGSMQMGQMHGGGSGGGKSQSWIKVNCRNCGEDYKHVHQENGEAVRRNEVMNPGRDHAYTASKVELVSLLRYAAMEWVPVTDTSPYLSAPTMSAIARRAHSVLDTKENS